MNVCDDGDDDECFDNGDDDDDDVDDDIDDDDDDDDDDGDASCCAYLDFEYICVRTRITLCTLNMRMDCKSPMK